jgi:undecaprenyl diphosphate synthase
VGVDTKRNRETRAESEEARRTRAEELKAKILEVGKLPRHVAIIMDGNGRWAKSRGLARIEGHQAGRRPVREAVEAAGEIGIEALTLYTFSIENWNRPRLEVDALMRFLRQTLAEERDELDRGNVRMATIGRTSELPDAVQAELATTIEKLSTNTGLLLTLALSYGGRAELVDAARALARDVAEGRLEPDAIDEASIEARLYTRELPSPDLLIRTSGEMRISNFLLWQLAYAEIYVTGVLWPDFDRTHFYEAILDYQRRERRFGRID